MPALRIFRHFKTVQKTGIETEDKRCPLPPLNQNATLKMVPLSTWDSTVIVAPRYNDQYPKFRKLKSDILPLQQLIDTLHKYHRCYDQEGYIEKKL